MGDDDGMDFLLDIAQKWAMDDPNPTTAEYVRTLIDQVKKGQTNLDQESSSLSTALATLRSFFPSDGSRIEFGTAGLRAPMKPGPLGLNDLVILQTTQGLVTYLKQQHQHNHLLAVVGYDHRSNPHLQISSKSLAYLTQAIFQQANIECIVFDDLIPTPFIAFATKYLHASIGIMVTASHNPKLDNGFKVYGSDGTQIRPPIDQEIQHCILNNLDPWILYPCNYNKRHLERNNDDNNSNNSMSTFTSQDLAKAYYRALAQSHLITGIGRTLNTAATTTSSSSSSSSRSTTIPKIVYSAMHGVGYPWAKQAIETFDLPPFLSVPEQEQPDPFFSTVVFPNPEEKGALQKAFQYASYHNANVVIANDPDADRLAVAEYSVSHGDSQTWTTFTGDQIGTMLGHWLWDQIGKHMTKVCRKKCKNNDEESQSLFYL